MSLTFKDELHAPTKPRSRRHRVKDSQPGLFGIRTWKKTRLVMACVFGAISIFPLLYMVSLSFQPTGDILTSHPVLVPTRPTVINYVQRGHRTVSVDISSTAWKSLWAPC